MPTHTVTKALTRAELTEKRAVILARTELVNVAEWGGSVRVRVMTGTERDAYEAEIVGNRTGKDRRLNLTNMRARFVARCLVDDDGAPLYDYRNPKDIDDLGGMDAAGLDVVFKAAQAVNGLTDSDVDDLTKNSKAEPSANSGMN